MSTDETDWEVDTAALAAEAEHGYPPEHIAPVIVLRQGSEVRNRRTGATGIVASRVAPSDDRVPVWPDVTPPYWALWQRGEVEVLYAPPVMVPGSRLEALRDLEHVATLAIAQMGHDRGTPEWATAVRQLRADLAALGVTAAELDEAGIKT